jgi:glutathione synthase/RimK-type ligase-like ATP-grasp enzyme
MKHLVLTTSPDSSIDLLKEFADVIVLDKQAVPEDLMFYDTLYIRSNFSKPSTRPELFILQVDEVVQRLKRANSDIQVIDNTDSVEKIIDIEDKWHQYKIFNKYMSHTTLLSSDLEVSDFKRPVFKHRLSSQGSGVTWNIDEATSPYEDWIVQESIDIVEELRIYVINNIVYPIATVRQSKTLNKGVKAIDFRNLASSELEFASLIEQCVPSLDFIGLDVAINSDGKLYLIEVNRSPGFGKFTSLTGINLARFLYGEDF